MSDLYEAIRNTLAPKPELPTVPRGYASLRVFIDMLEQHHEWCRILDTYYPGAVRARIDTEAEYNDQGGYFNTLTGVRAYDVNMDEVEFLKPDEFEFWDVSQEWSIPESGSFDRRRFESLRYYSREELQNVVRSLATLIEQLPDTVFRTDAPNLVQDFLE